VKITTAWCQRCPTWQVCFADHEDLAEDYADEHRRATGHTVHMDYAERKGITYKKPPTERVLLDHRGRVEGRIRAKVQQQR
jgi:hypothetical protein